MTIKTRRSKKVPIFKQEYDSLTPKQRAIRIQALEILSEIRRTNKSLSSVTSDKHISPRTVIRYTNAFRKRNGKWIAKKYDKIPRAMLVYENGEQKAVEITDSRYATAIGEYHNAIKEYLNTGKIEALKPFKRKRIKDKNGKYHKFEIDAETIKEINEAIEEPEFYEIYSP